MHILSAGSSVVCDGLLTDVGSVHLESRLTIVSMRRSRRSPARHHLMISGFHAAEKVDLGAKIVALGGKMLDGEVSSSSGLGLP